ncbi:ribosome maturation factor RimM [Chloroflexota bacterium]
MKSPELEFIIIGKILTPWGVSGKLEVRVETDFPQRFTPNSMIYIDRQPLTIDSSEWHRGKLIIKIKAIDSIEDAQMLRGQFVEIHSSQLYTLPEEQYYHHQIIGMEVQTIQGEILGTIKEVLPGPGNDNYIVAGPSGDILIPAVEDIVKSIDINKGLMTIEAIEGLLSLNQKADK